MKAFYKTAEFKALQATYYKKLKDSGFEDIETPRGDLIELHSGFQFSKRTNFKSDLFEDHREYFIWAEQMIAFVEGALERMIWELHSQGRSSSQISEVVGLERTWVNRKIKRIKIQLLQYQATCPELLEA